MSAGQVNWIAAHEKRRGKPCWDIKAAPHVMTRLKRIFTRADGGHAGQMILADTPENCRELLWFLDRYPMEVSDADRLKQRAEQHLRIEAAARDIVAQGLVKEGKVEMAVSPREYQLVAANLAVTTGRLLLADDVGLGKTCSAIATLCQAGRFPALFVTLTHLPRQIEAELKRFAPSLSTKILLGGSPGVKKKDKLDADLFGLPDVIICSYSKLTGWASTLAPLIQVVVFDEIQELRKNGSNKYAAAQSLAQRCSLILGLSATPIFNYGGEIYNVMNILQEDCLGDRYEFTREWCTYASDDAKARLRDPRAFGAYARESGLMLRRTRKDVGRELPALQVIPHYVDSDDKVLASMVGNAAELARKILASTPRDSVERTDHWRAHGEFDNKLRQATGLAKAPSVAEFVKMLIESGEQVVLFGWHRAVYDLWKIKLRDFNPVFYTGSETQSQKQNSLRQFIDGTSKVLILSLRAGAGIDGLQHVCRTCVFGELDWSPGVHEQCLGRVYRDGQPDPVVAYYLLAEEGADPIMSDVLGVKRGQIEGLRDPDAPLVEAGIDPDHLKRLAKDFLERRGEKFEDVEEIAC